MARPVPDPLGLYVHIPFCAAICNYCNFNRGLLDEPAKARYVDAIVRELTASAEPLTPADTLYFGGGTPSLLASEEVARIITAARQSFALAEDSEITLEANPETITPALLSGYRAAGVTRLSYGVQSFRDEELKRLGRLHSAATARAAVRTARAAGFDNISIDLMMWLPEQRLDQWLESVDALIEIAPEHASLYLLELYPNAPLKEDMARAGWSLAPDDDAAEMYEAALDRLEASGYRHYEISNVARPGREARHNVKYWRDGEWLAFGCGAHATRNGVRWRNVPATMDYIQRVTEGRSVIAERRVMDREERTEEALFTGLRLVAGLDLAVVGARYGIDVWARYGNELTRFVDAGLLIHEPGHRLALTRSGMLMANEVMQVFIGPIRTVK
ncbi:MAG TPA: radical SAM family heme chaperone HemW [Vicinamibacterales bacterium]|nr:radical SAM family heme chaperone HemW [Vicinamibacterales bacterium]